MRLTASLGALGGLGLLLAGNPALTAELMLSANDQKVDWDDAGKVVASAPAGTQFRSSTSAPTRTTRRSWSTFR